MGSQRALTLEGEERALTTRAHALSLGEAGHWASRGPDHPQASCPSSLEEILQWRREQSA